MKQHLATLLLLVAATRGHLRSLERHSDEPRWDDLRAGFDRPAYSRSSRPGGHGGGYPSTSRINRLVQ